MCLAGEQQVAPGLEKLNIKKKKSMSNIPLEVMILTKQIDQFEWEIQTEAVNVDDEKKLVNEIPWIHPLGGRGK